MQTFVRVLSNVRLALLATSFLLPGSDLFPQATPARQHIVVDVAHGQRFYSTPGTSTGNPVARVERVKYMTGEIEKNAAALNATVSYQKAGITPTNLAQCDVLFIHLPSSTFTQEEIKAIHQMIEKGGSLFLVMDEDYWTPLAKTNVNEILSPYDITYKNNNPDSVTSGGYTKPGPVTTQRFKIPYHGARIIVGGTPFCFSKTTEENPFGVYKELKNGGKLVVIGDGMVSLYMKEWEDVKDYQCAEFMQSVFGWLLK